MIYSLLRHLAQAHLALPTFSSCKLVTAIAFPPSCHFLPGTPAEFPHWDPLFSLVCICSSNFCICPRHRVFGCHCLSLFSLHFPLVRTQLCKDTPLQGYNQRVVFSLLSCGHHELWYCIALKKKTD